MSPTPSTPLPADCLGSIVSRDARYEFPLLDGRRQARRALPGLVAYLADKDCIAEARPANTEIRNPSGGATGLP